MPEAPELPTLKIGPLGLLLFLLVVPTTAGCPARGPEPATDDDDSGADDDDSSSGDDDDATCPDGATRCSDTLFETCLDGVWALTQACEAPFPTCDEQLGCLCIPESTWCVENTAWSCSEDGQTATLDDTCEGSARCVGGECFSACELAAAQQSYLGCDFVAVSTSLLFANDLTAPNGFDDDFGLFVANPGSGEPAEVEVTLGGAVVGTNTVAPGAAYAFQLDAVTALTDAWDSSTVADGAFLVSSNEPIVAYQFAPLHRIHPLDSDSYSFSNDASLLLPVHAFDLTHRAVARAAFAQLATDGATWQNWAELPGKMAVVAVEDGTSVTLEMGGDTAPGTPSSLQAGDVWTTTLDRGDVLQIIGGMANLVGGMTECSGLGFEQSERTCGGSNQLTCVFCSETGTDLTGTTVTSSAPVAVFSGSKCSYVPYDRPTCDHLEEMIPPTSTWGQEAVVTAPLEAQDPSLGVDARMVRVLADVNATIVTFDPPVAVSVTLDAGEWVELQSEEDFVVTGTQPILVTEILSSFSNPSSSNPEPTDTAGDPSMVVAVPSRQWRTQYTVLSPSTFDSNHANVMALTGADVQLDGVPIAGWEPITGTAWSVARLTLPSGVHEFVSPQGDLFGVVSYGYGPYVSYAYPGGLDLTR